MGPHFYFDLIRLPRKGWSTFFRCLYLLVLLVGLTLMYEGRRHGIRTPGDFARFAHLFAYTLIVLQDLLVLLLLPVYVASAVAEERENQTLDALFLSPLSDTQIVLGKFGGRVLHLGAVVLAGVPLLAFMHMWGNVAVSMLVYHLVNTLLLAMTASSVCILVSTHSPMVFQAVTTSYPFVFVLGLMAEIVAFGLPWFVDAFYPKGTGVEGSPRHWESLALLVPGHVMLTWAFLASAVTQLSTLRRLETVPLKTKSAAFSLGDRRPAPRVRKGKLQGSHIHPLALPISDQALLWKECSKDGSRWSLTWSWLVVFALVVVAASAIFQWFVHSFAEQPAHLHGGHWLKTDELRQLMAPFAYSAYFIALAAYALLVVFQTTLAVAGEREQNTLEFLLMLPMDRREVLFAKWWGPLWRNWPIVAVSYFGILLGLGCGIYSPLTALVLSLLPWPFLLACSFTALWLSVSCRRVLFANVVMVGFLLFVLMAHIVSASFIVDLFPAYAYLMFKFNYNEVAETDIHWGLVLVLLEQLALLGIAGVCAFLAFRKFQGKDYQGKI